jgi:HTH-type transcriptional repressor of NAD biosynthesis genes
VTRKEKDHKLKRVVIVGAESTGTTSTALQLAEHYRTLWVPEYGRDYTEARRALGAKGAWRSDEFVHIALIQQRNEDEYAKHAHRVLFCDTDALATCVWHERYMYSWSKEVEAIADKRRYDLYIVTQPDIPFVQDRIRDSAHLRDWMTTRFIEEIEKRKVPHILLAGTMEERMKMAIERVDKLLESSS